MFIIYAPHKLVNSKLLKKRKILDRNTKTFFKQKKKKLNKKFVNCRVTKKVIKTMNEKE